MVICLDNIWVQPECVSVTQYRFIDLSLGKKDIPQVIMKKGGIRRKLDSTAHLIYGNIVQSRPVCDHPQQVQAG